jgi:hypothetical protein
MYALMTYFQIIVLFFLGCLPSFAQDFTFRPDEIEGILIESGENKNHYTYDLGDYTFFKGVYENNLTFKIQNKMTGDIEFAYKDTISDAMILIPKFFKNEDNSIIVIMIEVAAEYSWGQEIVLINNRTVNYLGYLNYAVAADNEESLAEYCTIKENQGKIIMSFEDVPIIDYSDADKVINGEDLKFELSTEGIKKIN